MMKPKLASPAELDKIVYPVLVSPKLDGIRCLGQDDGPMSRTGKPIPNSHARELLKALDIWGLDGELMVDGDFNEVQSAIMKREGRPSFTYNVFDCFYSSEEDVSHLPFRHRYAIAKVRCMRIGLPVRLVPHVLVRNENGLLAMLERYILQGYEGLMVRDTNGPYKQGRSTVREGLLLKVKKFFDDEGELVEIREKMTNNNPAEFNELGYTKRSSAKENLEPAGTAGAMVVAWRGEEVKVGFGPGITDAVKQEWWDNREHLKGHALKFSYQDLSKDGVPRFGKALGFRHKEDM